VKERRSIIGKKKRKVKTAYKRTLSNSLGVLEKKKKEKRKFQENG